MGNYIQYSDLEGRLTSSVLENLSGQTGTALTGFINGIISRAEAFVNAYASVRYQTPLPEDELISEWTLRIAEYELYKRGPGANVPEKIRESYKECVSLLNDLSQGKLHLSCNPVPAAASGKSFYAQKNGFCNETLFSKKDMPGY